MNDSQPLHFRGLIKSPLNKCSQTKSIAFMTTEFIFPLQLKLRAGEYVVYDRIPAVRMDYGYSPGYFLVTNYRVVYIPFVRKNFV